MKMKQSLKHHYEMPKKQTNLSSFLKHEI